MASTRPATRSVHTPPISEAKVFALHGIRCRSKPSGVRERCVLLMDVLAHPELPLVVSRRCHWTIEAVATALPDPHLPERYDKRSRYEHILDALRYFAVNGPPIGRPRSSGSSIAFSDAHASIAWAPAFERHVSSWSAMTRGWLSSPKAASAGTISLGPLAR